MASDDYYFDNSLYNKTWVMSALKDTSGNFSMNANYSGGATDFSVTCPSDKKYYVHNLVLCLLDGATGFTLQNFGAVTALTNGVKVFYKPSGQSKTYLNSDYPLKSNFDIASVCTTFQHYVTDSLDTDQQGLKANLTFHDKFALVLSEGDSFGIELNDNLSGLTDMKAFVQLTSRATNV